MNYIDFELELNMANVCEADSTEKQAGRLADVLVHVLVCLQVPLLRLSNGRFERFVAFPANRAPSDPHIDVFRDELVVALPPTLLQAAYAYPAWPFTQFHRC